jgi:hypothetical protein
MPYFYTSKWHGSGHPVVCIFSDKAPSLKSAVMLILKIRTIAIMKFDNSPAIQNDGEPTILESVTIAPSVFAMSDEDADQDETPETDSAYSDEPEDSEEEMDSEELEHEDETEEHEASRESEEADSEESDPS